MRRGWCCGKFRNATTTGIVVTVVNDYIFRGAVEKFLLKKNSESRTELFLFIYNGMSLVC